MVKVAWFVTRVFVSSTKICTSPILTHGFQMIKQNKNKVEKKWNCKASKSAASLTCYNAICDTYKYNKITGCLPRQHKEIQSPLAKENHKR